MQRISNRSPFACRKATATTTGDQDEDPTSLGPCPTSSRCSSILDTADRIWSRKEGVSLNMLEDSMPECRSYQIATIAEAGAKTNQELVKIGSGPRKYSFLLSIREESKYAPLNVVLRGFHFRRQIISIHE
uniref:Uncharacterized protein n=1 Tax=Caenorhabditis japonica TaxID=281687 RepID=A0A8R1I779_CAEJA